MEEKSDGLSPRSSEQRMHPRYAVDDCATLFLLNHGASVSGQIIDLSLGGCRLRLPVEFRVRPHTRVEVTFKVHGIAFRLSGITQWTDGRRTVGVCFGEISSRRRDELCELMAEIQSEAEAQAAKSETDQLAEKQPEGKERIADVSVSEAGSARLAGQSKLVAAPPPRDILIQEKSPVVMLAKQKQFQQDLERKLTRQTAATRARTQTLLSVLPALHRPLPLYLPTTARDGAPKEPETQKQEMPSQPIEHSASDSRERRTQSRHSVDSSASIFLVDVASKSAGRIVDVSLGGCRIRTDERFPVGIYRRVEVEFVLDGLPFRLGGVTQSLHNRIMVGVRFLNLSDRKREQLQMLVEEMDQMNNDLSEKIPEAKAEPL